MKAKPVTLMRSRSAMSTKRFRNIAVTTAIAGLCGALVWSCYSPTEYASPERELKPQWASKQEIEGFVGTSEVKFTYTLKTTVNGSNSPWVYFVDFAQDAPKAVRLKKPAGMDNIFADSPLISPDGSYVTYFLRSGNTPRGAYVQELSPDAEPVLVDENGGEPHWWKDSVGNVYIVYCDELLVENIAEGQGKTYRRPVTLGGSNPTIGSAVELANVAMTGGLSRDGKFLCTGYYDAAFYDLESNNLIKINEGVQVCNPAISTDPNNPHEMLFLNFQGPQKLNGFTQSIEQHAAIIFADVNNAATNSVMSGDFGYSEWQDPDWSNHPNFIAALGMISTSTADGVIVDLEEKNLLKLNRNGNILDNTSTPSLWVSGVDDPVSNDPLAMLYPSAGDTVKVGETVTVQWAVNSTNVSSVVVMFSSDAGKNWEQLTTRAIVPSQATSLEWTVLPSQAGDQCFLRIYDYNDESVEAYSDLFVVTQ
ncbi:MAG: hypothetical protein GF344_06500 [Chitinivibrionales bacterium]|nr:hypothetical protein [Chitinivibrionales bacterium]MBD3356576.1 hypothetical protein [Chitinivibrionales bacterium]